MNTKEKYPDIEWVGKGARKTKHITPFDENGNKMRVDVSTGEIVARESIKRGDVK